MPSVNLQKHGSAMQTALKSVRDPKNSTDWVLFGYDGKSFDLKVVATGEDGIEELVDDLNASKILYGFIQVKDPKSTLPKFVFLHWQGEGCPVTLKGQASNLLRDVQKFIGSYQISITARNEDEVDVNEIMKQVEKASTSKFSFKTRKEIPKDAIPVTDVKSVYQKVITTKDKTLNMETRNKFWEGEQERKKEIQRTSFTKKDFSSTSATKNTWQSRETEAKKIQTAPSNAKKSNSSSTFGNKNIPEPSMSLKDRMKMLDESKKETNAPVKETFQTPQAKTSPVPALPSISKPSQPALPSLSKPSQPKPQVVSVSSVEEDYESEEDTSGVQYDESEDQNVYDNVPDDCVEEGAYENEPELVACTFNNEDHQEYDQGEQMYENIDTDDLMAPQQDLGICAVTLYDYEAEDENEVSFEPGEVITNIDKPDENWWEGLTQSGKFGLFPANYVEQIDPSELEVS